MRVVKSTLFLLLAGFAIYGGTPETTVTVDSLVGKAEVQRAGHAQWDFIQNGAKLYNNDIMRVLDKGLVRLLWPDGSSIYVHKNSQILINIVQSNQDNTIMSHVTIFFGALFYVAKKVLPRELLPPETEIYTPTTVVSLRGTSFSVSVDQTTGSTKVKMISGTTLVRNILKNVSSFITAPYQTEVDMNTDPIVLNAVLQADIDSLKTWIPADVIDDEITRQIAQSKRDYRVITGKFEDKLVILPFTNNSSYKGAWQIARLLPEFFAKSLGHSIGRISIALADSEVKDPLQYATLSKSRFIITGSIETFDITQHAEISASADQYREYSVAKVRIHLQLLDASENKMLTDEYFAGEVSGKNKLENTWQEIGKYKCDLADKQFAGSMLGAAIQQALDQASEKLSKYLDM